MGLRSSGTKACLELHSPKGNLGRGQKSRSFPSPGSCSPSLSYSAGRRDPMRPTISEYFLAGRETRMLVARPERLEKALSPTALGANILGIQRRPSNVRHQIMSDREGAWPSPPTGGCNRMLGIANRLGVFARAARTSRFCLRCNTHRRRGP